MELEGSGAAGQAWQKVRGEVGEPVVMLAVTGLAGVPRKVEERLEAASATWPAATAVVAAPVVADAAVFVTAGGLGVGPGVEETAVAVAVGVVDGLVGDIAAAAARTFVSAAPEGRMGAGLAEAAGDGEIEDIAVEPGVSAVDVDLVAAATTAGYPYPAAWTKQEPELVVSEEKPWPCGATVDLGVRS